MGRMIDVDALFEAMENIEWYNNADRDEVAEVLVMNAPTIEERKTGRWRRMPMACYGGGTITEYECSECEEHQLITSNYCPNCGCKMEVEHE